MCPQTPFTFDTQVFLEVLLKGVGFPGTDNNTGEALSPLAAEGELRLSSDGLFARDSRTACEWQAQISKLQCHLSEIPLLMGEKDNQQLMMTNFKNAMAHLAVIGQNTANLVDCSEVIPTPVPPVAKPAT